MENNENMNNQVNNNVQEEKKNNNKAIGIVVLIIGLLLVGLAVYKLFIEKPEIDKPKDDNTQEKENIVNGEQIYKTKDGKFTLKIVDKNDQNAAKKFANEEWFEDSIVKYYAYFNNTLLVITNVKEDSHYATYSFAGYEYAEAFGYKLIVNKDTNVIEISPEELNGKSESCMENNFCDFPHQPFFIKTELGYFFGYENYGLTTLYTTSWKKLGYVYLDNSSDDYKLEEISSDGVIVYSNSEAKECDGNDCSYELSNPTKYDINGNVVNN